MWTVKVHFLIPTRRKYLFNLCKFPYPYWSLPVSPRKTFIFFSILISALLTSLYNSAEMLGFVIISFTKGAPSDSYTLSNFFFVDTVFTSCLSRVCVVLLFQVLISNLDLMTCQLITLCMEISLLSCSYVKSLISQLLVIKVNGKSLLL